MKISELNTKSFLGGAGAAANSYVLINYEDNSTSEPITYKATIQELGKAIANDLQLYKKTQEGAVTTSVNNGAYVDGAVSGLASTGYVTNAISGLASTGYVTSEINTATSGLASTGALSTKASIGYVNYCGRKIFAQGDKYVIKDHADASNSINLTEAMLETDCSIDHTRYFPIGAYIDPTDYDATLYRYNPTAKEMQALQLDENNISNAISGLASTGYVTNAVSGLASTGYVTAAVVNAGGGGSFDPTESISCEFIPYGVNGSDPIEGNLYPVMTSGNALYRGYNGTAIESIVPLDKILFYEIEESEGSPHTLLLKNINKQLIHSIQLN